jgi:hypothetical protein
VARTFSSQITCTNRKIMCFGIMHIS